MEISLVISDEPNMRCEYEEFSRKVVFLHIPKTGGTSLRHWLSSSYKPEDFFPAYLTSEQLTFTIEALQRYTVFCGHLDWSSLDCLGGDRFVFTVLRQLVDRLISHFCFWKRNGRSEKL